MIKNSIESLDESKSKPLMFEDYLNTYDTCRDSLAFEIENDLVLACFDWKVLRVNDEHEVRWHLTSVFEVFIDENKNPAQHYQLSKQPYTASSSQSDSIYNNLIRLNPDDAKQLVLSKVALITLSDGMTIRPFGEYFTICHKIKQNKWYNAHVSLNDLQFINLKPLESEESTQINIAEIAQPIMAFERHKNNVITCLEELMKNGRFSNLLKIPTGIKGEVIEILKNRDKHNNEYSGEDSVRKAWQHLSKSGQISHVNKDRYKKK